VLAVERQVVLGVAAAEHELVRQGGEGLLDEFGRELGHGRLAIDGGAVRLEHVEGALGVVGDADLGEHVEGGLVDPADLVGIEQRELDAPADVALVCVGHGGSFQGAACSAAEMIASNSRRRSSGSGSGSAASNSSTRRRARSASEGAPAARQAS